MQIEIVDCHWSLTLLDIEFYEIKKHANNSNNHNITHNYTAQMNQYSGEVTSLLAAHFILTFFFLVPSFSINICMCLFFLLLESNEIIFSICWSFSSRAREWGKSARTFGQAHHTNHHRVNCTSSHFEIVSDHCHHSLHMVYNKILFLSIH